MEKRDIVLNADQLRKLQSSDFSRQTKKRIKRNEIYIILDNVLDTYNIGSVFRLADAVAAKKLYLCGGTETPPNHRIKKASINTTEVVDWEYCESAVEAVNKVRDIWSRHPECNEGSLTHVSNTSNKLRDSSSQAPQNDRKGIIIAIEQTNKLVPYDDFEYKLPVALIVGHETNGVSQEALDASDAVVELPMFGVNKSLNVMVSLAIVLYRILSDTRFK